MLFFIVTMFGIAFVMTGVIYLKFWNKIGPSSWRQRVSEDSFEAQQQKVQKENMNILKYSFSIFFLFAGLLLFIQSITIVKTSHVGVISLYGEVNETVRPVIHEGIHLVHPFAKVIPVFIGTDVAAAKNAEGGSKDLQRVHITMTSNYYVDPVKVVALYRQSPSLSYESSFIVPAMYEIFKAVTARYTAEELITKREEVSQGVKTALQAKLVPIGIVIRDINMLDFSFSKAFNEGVEAKVLVTQQAEAAQRGLEKARFEAQSRIVEAEAQAKVIKIQSEAVTASGGEGFIRLEAIKKWNGELPTMMTANTPLPFVNVK